MSDDDYRGADYDNDRGNDHQRGGHLDLEPTPLVQYIDARRRVHYHEYVSPVGFTDYFPIGPASTLPYGSPCTGRHCA